MQWKFILLVASDLKLLENILWVNLETRVHHALLKLLTSVSNQFDATKKNKIIILYAFVEKEVSLLKIIVNIYFKKGTR